MRQIKMMPKSFNNQHGATVVLVAILLVPILGFVALAIDFGLHHVSKNELQNAADAAALAGARKIGTIYRSMAAGQQASYDCSNTSTHSGSGQDCNQITAAAAAAYTANKVFGTALSTADVRIGIWPDSNPSLPANTFTVRNSRPNAVFVKVKRTGSTNGGAIPTFLAKIFGLATMAVEAKATAALTPLKKSSEVELPYSISETRFAGGNCGDVLILHPTSDPNACGGYTDITLASTKTPVPNDIKTICSDAISGATPTTISTGDIAGITNATMDNVFASILALFENRGYDVDANGNARMDADHKAVAPDVVLSDIGSAVPLMNPDNPTEQLRYPSTPNANKDYACPADNCDGALRYKHVWDTTVPVYSYPSNPCGPSGDVPIVGFAEVQITNVSFKNSTNGNKDTITGIIKCSYSEDIRGSGGGVGTLPSIPNLVQPQNDPSL